MTWTSRALPVEEWPEADRTLWQKACASADDFLDEVGIASTWRPATRRNVQEGYGHALFWLRRHGELDPTLAPSSRWTAERLRRYVTEMRACLKPSTIHVRLVTLEQMVRVIEPDADRSVLKRAKRATHARPDWVRKRQRLRRPDELADFGMELMLDAENTTDRKWHLRASDFRDGLIIAMLAYVPLRHRNMHGLEIGRHLVRRGVAWWITIPGEEMKNHRPLEVEVPRFVVDALERYIEHWRPMLCRGRYTGTRLWVTFYGKPLKYKAFGHQVQTRTAREFGISIPPHAFRDAAATAIALDDPGNFALAASVLGHARLATTQRYYTIAGSHEAATSFGQTLERLRSEAANLDWEPAR
ncbi:MAG: site-specific integrase [Parvibaculaceae bacterium]